PYKNRLIPKYNDYINNQIKAELQYLSEQDKRTIALIGAYLKLLVVLGDPPISPGLLDLAISDPAASSNLARLAQQVTPTRNASLTSGTDRNATLSVAGTLAASWSTAATSAFATTSLTATQASVTDLSGHVLGSGVVSLSTTTTVDVSVMGNDQVDVQGK